MLYYTLNNLDSYIQDSSLKEQIEIEISKLDDMILTYENKGKTFQNMTDTILNTLNNIEENNTDKLYKSSTLLKETIENNNCLIQNIIKLKSSLLNILDIIDSDLNLNSYVDNTSEIKNILIEYNKYYEKIQKDINVLENNITHILNDITTLSLLSNTHNINNENNSQNNTNLIYTVSEDNNNLQYLENSKNTNTTNKHSNNLLIVSEKDQKAYLPYNYLEIEKIYNNKKNIYSCIQDVIEKLYILPLKNFKNSITSRFREGFKLIKERENGSTLKALSLGLELMFKYNLNPIIIAACRNVDELDIYLDCLEENQLNAFKCFQIRFEIMPKI